jgi:hypothetical protein
VSILRPTIHAFCQEVAQFHGLAALEDDVDFILFQLSNMPAFLAWPLRGAIGLFSLSGLVFGGSLFHRLTPNARERLIGRWREAPLSPCRDVIRFLASLALLSIYSRYPAPEAERP